ncbi:hypothetical protein FF38_03256 [Lucilia cuprina]|uniref:Uncharacterized protein n=1 Tax=Lucilia cuprina TaxID=7375 RepID=A0A0L0CLP0_LUCCU|nr:hypothetical protein FF38_03256 [Lucilia cuprina]
MHEYGGPIFFRKNNDILKSDCFLMMEGDYIEVVMHKYKTNKMPAQEETANCKQLVIRNTGPRGALIRLHVPPTCAVGTAERFALEPFLPDIKLENNNFIIALRKSPYIAITSLYIIRVYQVYSAFRNNICIFIFMHMSCHKLYYNRMYSTNK